MGAEKYLGSIGYILALVGIFVSVPYARTSLLQPITLIGLLMVAMAWLLLGIREKDTLLKATGVAIIVAPIIILALAFAIAYPLLKPPSPHGVPFVSPGIFLSKLITVFVVAAIVIVAVVILHIAAHFRAARKLQISTFKYAGVTHATALVLAVALTVALFTTFLTRAQEILGAMLMGTPPLALLSTVILIAIIMAVVQIAAYILSAMSFLKLT